MGKRKGEGGRNGRGEREGRGGGGWAGGKGGKDWHKGGWACRVSHDHNACTHLHPPVSLRSSLCRQTRLTVYYFVAQNVMPRYP